MEQVSACPDREAIAKLARDDLPLSETEALEQHFSQCRSCLDRFKGLGQREPFPLVKDCHIVAEIGRGRFGVVYKAWFLTGKPRLAALKLLSFAGEMESGRFEREIKVLKQIDSPNIVKCIKSGWAGETPYYLMDLVKGVHLDEFLVKTATGLDAKLAVFGRVCEAVADAHRKDVIHRDLKPKNILVDADGEPHILDFGICAVGPEGWGTSTRGDITHVGDIIGTLKYMSPEQAWGEVNGPVDKRTDIWALGIMLYEIVTNGDYPYELGPTNDKSAREALLERIRKEMPKRPLLGSIEHGRDLQILLERCLSWEREQRLYSVAQLGQDIGRHRRRQRIQTKPFSLAHRAKRLAVGVATKSRWQALLALIAIVAFTLWTASLVLDVRWRISGSPDRTARSSAGLPQPGHGRDGIVVVGISDETVGKIVQYAAENDVDGVTPQTVTWRAVHGRLMQRLAVAKPIAVVWDYFFRTPQSGDPGFVEGAGALHRAGVPVVLAAVKYDATGAPELSPAIVGPLQGMVHHGMILARDMVARPGEFLIVVRHGDDNVVPSLALATLAAVLHPDCRLDIEWTGRATRFDVLYEVEPGSYLRDRDSIEFTRVYENARPDAGVAVGSLVGCTTLPLDPPGRWQQRTIPYEQLLLATDDELRAAIGGKVLIVGDMRSPQLLTKRDLHSVDYGSEIVENVPGCYLVADAVAGLLDQRSMKTAFPLRHTTFLTLVILAAVGCLVPIGVAAHRLLEGRGSRRLLWSAALGLSAMSLLAMTVSETFWVVHAGMAAFSLLLPMCGSFWIEFARNHHVVSDRQMRAIQCLQLQDSGTLTIP